MSLIFFAVMVTFFFLLSGVFLVAAFRAYGVRVRITYPLRRVVAMNDYQDIFSTLTRIGARLDPKNGRLVKRTKRLWLRRIALWKPINTLFFRPPTFNAIRVHLPYAYANLSEVSRRRFRSDPGLLNFLKDIFIRLNHDIFQGNNRAFCKHLADYYRLMRFQDAGLHHLTDGTFLFSESQKCNLERLKSSISQGDLFNAYQILLGWGRDEIISRLNDLELLAVSYLTARVESMVQGAEYLISGKDIRNILSDLTFRIDTICTAVSKNNPSLLLDAVS